MQQEQHKITLTQEQLKATLLIMYSTEEMLKAEAQEEKVLTDQTVSITCQNQQIFH